MTGSEPRDTHPFVRKFARVAQFALSSPEKAALISLPMRVARIEARQDIIREHERPSRSFAVLSGIVGAYKVTRPGDRQIVAYYVTGDVPDFQSLHLDVLDFTLAAITPCRVGFVDHDALRSLLRDHPRLVDVIWRATLIDAAIVREWLLNNGRRDSYARLAHLFCELLTRLKVVGLAQDYACNLPLTQVELGDALGISTVHVSRTLKDLREAGLLTLKGGRLTVHDWPQLVVAGEFDPTYLHIRRPVLCGEPL